MAANPDTDVVSGRIWQGKNPYWFTGVQYSTEFGIVKSITGSSMIIQTYPGTAGSNSLECERYFPLYRITIAAIDGTSLCLEIITLEAFASPARLDGIISSRLPK